MKKWIAYPFSIFYYGVFGFLLLVFHPLQVFGLKVFGLEVQKKTVDLLNFFLLQALRLVGIKIKFQFGNPLPQNRCLIFVSNHQSTYDIPPLIWYLRKFSPKFIAKKELGGNIPSISYHLKNGGNVLIDRKDSTAAIQAIKEFCKAAQKNKWSIVIFPEGTRSRDGRLMPFQKGGLRTLLKEIPDALLVPICVQNSWKLAQWNYFPLPLGTQLTVDVLETIEPSEHAAEKITDVLEQRIQEQLKN